MSELDINSDSDWLDISSGRDSDDNVSLSDQDDEISSVPRSRRSSFSTESSMGGDVEAWEGFVSDSDARDFNGMYSVTLRSATTAEHPVVRTVPDGTEFLDPAIAEEEKRVREALDQSFVGTLSASRASTSGMHNSSTPTSVRDLRLSFPDPLTSSRNELNRSYEDVPSTTSGSDLNSSTEFKPDSIIGVPAPVSSLPHFDPGSLFSTPEDLCNENKEPRSERVTELDIVLYGTSSAIKWSFVQEFVQKASYATGHEVLNTLEDDKTIQSLHLARKPVNGLKFFETVNVIDRTGENRDKVEPDYDTTSGRVSLAIVYLPTAQLPLITWHDTFLPVLIPSSPEVESQNSVMLQAAEDDWELLAVPINQTLRLIAGGSSVFDSEKLSELKPFRVYELLCNIGQQSKIVNHARPITEKIKMNRMALVGLMSVVMGLAMNTLLHSPTPLPTPTVNSPSSSNQLWQVVQPNSSVVGPSTSYSRPTKGFGISSTFEQLALSVYDTRSISISAVASNSQSNAVASTSSVHQCKQCSKTSTDLQRDSTDLAIRSSSNSLSQVPRSLPATVSSSKAIATTSSVVLSRSPESIMTALSTSAAGLNKNYKAISEAFGATTKALTEAFNSDFGDFAVAADDLLSSFMEQTDSVIRQSKGKARALSEQIGNLNGEVHYRNERAKSRAKELRKKGGDIVRVARDELKERTEKARRRARRLSQTVVENGEAWTAYGARLAQEGGMEPLSKLAKERYERWRGICEQPKQANSERDKRHARVDKENSGCPRGAHRKGFRACH